jgi:type II secretory pathway pseudopilin PulG
MPVALALLALAAFLGAAYYVQPDPVDPATGSNYVQPTQLNDDGTVTTDGVTPVDPAALAAGQGLEPNRYAMARAIVSEVGGLPLAAQIGVAWSIRNMASHAGVSVLRLITRAGTKVNGVWTPTAGADGFFGRQDQHRYCSSARDADDAAYRIADQVTSGDVDDPTGGARQWDSPDAFSSSGAADQTAANRIAAGNVEVNLPGVDPNQLRFWRPA